MPGKVAPATESGTQVLVDPPGRRSGSASGLRLTAGAEQGEGCQQQGTVPHHDQIPCELPPPAGFMPPGQHLEGRAHLPIRTWPVRAQAGLPRVCPYLDSPPSLPSRYRGVGGAV